MVETNGLRQPVQRIEGRPGRIVPGFQGRRITRAPHEDHAHGMAARVTVRARIHAQHAQQLHIETGLLAHLAHGGMFHLLAVVHEASRQGKAVRLVDTFDDHHAPFGIIDDHIRGGNNIDLISYKKPIIPFEFADFGEAVLGKTEAKTVNITYSEQNKTALVYDADKQNYVLYKNERIKTDMLNGETVSFKNVFVLFADIVTYETASGTESVVKNDTSGTGYYISNGTLMEIKWCKDSSGELTFRTLIGNKLIINRGNSYIGYYKSSAMDAVTFQ